MRKNKMGAMFLVSVLALAGIGVSYAGFTDVIDIYGSVETATVTWEVVGYSCTYIWKIWDYVEGWDPVDDDCMTFDLAKEIARYHGPCADYYDLEEMYFYEAGEPQCQYEYVSFAKARAGAEPYDVEMDFNNLFPCQDFTVDTLIHYTGSIPGKINNGDIFVLYEEPGTEGWLECLWDSGAVTFGACRAALQYPELPYHPVDNPIVQLGEAVDVGTQLHNCNYIYAWMTIHLPQDNMWQNLYGEFGAWVEIVQWNELGYDSGYVPPQP